jgi:RNA polymerase sigma factor (sigma-70 family)
VLTGAALNPGLPTTLERLCAADAAQRDQAWDAFIEVHSHLVLRVCRSLTRDHDVAMDGYTSVLSALRDDECRRLRAYVPDGRTKFTTWLAVVTRRLMLDYLRHHYGRPRSEDPNRRADHATRRNLESLVAADVDPDRIATSSNVPDADVRREELLAALRSAIARLPARERFLLTLKYVDGLSGRVIARTLGLPSVFHAYRRLDAALATLRADLESRGIEGAEP